MATTTKKKASHCVMRNNQMFCTHCGRGQALPIPIESYMFSAMAKAFEKHHKDCKKTWKQPEVDQSLSEVQKAMWWLKNGEHGISSETIYSVIANTIGLNVMRNPFGYNHPADPDDFYRCHKLLITVPEWREKMHLMKPISDVWSNLVDNWDELTVLLEEQLKTGKANGMYELMKKLGC